MTAPKVLAIVGPTASGKTGSSYLIANQLTEKFNREPVIISADSRQVYKHIPIAASYPPEEYLKKYKHYFIGELELDKEFNAGEYGKKAREIISSLLAENKIPLIAGGSGLYINSLIYGLFDYDEALEEGGLKDKQKIIRQSLTERLHNEGINSLLDELKRVDEVSAGRMSNVNQRRIIRALEVYYTTGIPISELQNKKIDVRFETVQYALKWERAKLYERINIRVDEMLKQGLLGEIQWLKEKGYSYKEFNSLNTVGVKEVFDYLEGIITYDRMVELIKQNTRRFAKRQLTWFRRDKNINWIDVNNENDLEFAANEICNKFY
jgi:tRNA dimethylallyltransferase